jgi:hypothetical protein
MRAAGVIAGVRASLGTDAMKGRAWLPPATVSTAVDGTWAVVYRPGAPGSAWLSVGVYKPGQRTGREKQSYGTGYNPEEGRLARSSDERCMFEKRRELTEDERRLGRPETHAARSPRRGAELCARRLRKLRLRKLAPTRTWWTS